MVGRPREFHRQQALRRAMETFWEKGYQAASVGDLLAAMGINRGSMYATFGGKHALFLEALEHYSARALRDCIGRLERPGEPAEVLRELVRSWGRRAASVDQRGCFLVNSLAERGPQDHAVQAIVRRTFGRIEDMLCQKLAAARRAGELMRAAQPRSLARFLVNVLQGLIVQSKLPGNRGTVRDTVNVCLSLLR
jgi:TetR/AcrR family transcriptional repressor of nem operon